ncbi:hypothetical protein [Winogradskyella sp. 3972H.M.0a.05]|uniref:hypothetical protein n=1 Tax=Winogradskyella sp. 3972H.M.0a.05 TaxID=2950277 RepID=UPI0033993F38
MQLRLNRYGKIGLFLVASIIISIALLRLFEKRFDTEDWKRLPTERYKMVDNLIEQQLLIGKTKEEAIKLLGKPNATISSASVFLYEIGTVPSFFKSKTEQLLIVFEDEKAIKVTLADE